MFNALTNKIKYNLLPSETFHHRPPLRVYIYFLTRSFPSNTAACKALTLSSVKFNCHDGWKHQLQSLIFLYFCLFICFNPRFQLITRSKTQRKFAQIVLVNEEIQSEKNQSMKRSRSAKVERYTSSFLIDYWQFKELFWAQLQIS